jgi:hypothetical protein
MDARQLPARHGALWLLAGFALFRRHPPLMTAITFGYLLIGISISRIQILGLVLLPLILPALTVMLANGCRTIERGKAFDRDTLIAGISEQRVGLIRLGGLHLLGSSLLTMAAFAALGEPINIKDGIDSAEAMVLATDLAVILLLASPLLMAFWFAPLLTAWDGVSAGKSVFFSFIASWRNWRAFTAYGMAVMLVGGGLPRLIIIVAEQISPSLVAVANVALIMLLVFVLLPATVASMYLSYRDVFAVVAPEPAPPDE